MEHNMKNIEQAGNMYLLYICGKFLLKYKEQKTGSGKRKAIGRVFRRDQGIEKLESRKNGLCMDWNHLRSKTKGQSHDFLPQFFLIRQLGLSP
jgi:hypothetical protein